MPCTASNTWASEGAFAREGATEPATALPRAAGAFARAPPVEMGKLAGGGTSVADRAADRAE
eukprot:3126055-Amphidinium_carterae.2